MARVSTDIPTQHTAGDSFAATFSSADYPATSGWTAQLVLIGPQRITLTATAAGSSFRATANSAATASWPAGEYALRALFTLAGERASEDAGRLRVSPDPGAATTTDQALKSTAQRVLEDLERAYQAYLSGGQVGVAEYTINGRTMKYRSVAELLQALSAARRDVANELAAARIAAGLGGRQRFVTRM
jgi:hypothetical protein